MSGRTFEVRIAGTGVGGARGSEEGHAREVASGACDVYGGGYVAGELHLERRTEKGESGSVGEWKENGEGEKVREDGIGWEKTSASFFSCLQSLLTIIAPTS